MEKYYVMVKNEDAARFMNEVKPQRATINMNNKDYVAFVFDSRNDDYIKAQKWSYANYDLEVTGDDDEVIGYVYYDDAVGYCFVCADDGHEEQGFSRPDKAECALLDYFYQD